MLDTPSRTRLLHYIRQSKETRRMPYDKVAIQLDWNVSEPTIRKALQKDGLGRRIARRKPPFP